MSTNFDETDVRRGKELRNNISQNQVNLGELADGIETKYGEGTLEEFAEAIGVDYNTLKGYRYVHRRWKSATSKPRTYALAKALASYKDKDWYIENWPDATEREAREDVRFFKKKAKEKTGEEKGRTLPNVDRLLTEIGAKVEKWSIDLDLLSHHRVALTGSEIERIVKVLSLNIKELTRYRDNFKATTNITIDA
jgi:hypothetical protein